jgi:hypothetical protein
MPMVVMPPSSAARVSFRLFLEGTLVADMDVGVEDAGQHRLARCVVDIRCLYGQVFADGGDPSLRDADIGVDKADSRDDEGPAFDQERERIANRAHLFTSFGRYSFVNAFGFFDPCI